MKNPVLAGAAALASLIGAAAQAGPVDVKFAMPAPPRSLVNQWVFVPWAKEVNAASEGTLEVKIIGGPTMGNFRNVYGRTVKGVADISFGIHGPMGAQFRKTSVGLLPYESHDVLEASRALWDVYAKGLIADEYKDVKVLALFNFPASSIHTKDKPIKTMEDMQGMKISVSSAMNARIMGRLGATPVTMTPTGIYQSMNRGVISGFMIAWTAVGPFKLAEVSKYHLDVLAFGGGTAFVVMNKRKFARLPAKAKQAIERRTGEVMSRRLGRTNLRIQAFFRSRTEKMPDHVLSVVSPAEAARWQARLADVTDDWVKQTPDGARILEGYRDATARIRAGN